MLSPQDFKSSQEVRWCAGCGDHAILSAMQKALPAIAEQLNLRREDFVFVSGIGCSSRFPYYMNTYGFHTIHGRASAVAAGVKAAKPRLSVWQITGDGDALAIGGNHFIHALRRNIDINIVLFNNEIYGLTKGQYSPTSKMGIVTKTSPYGSIEQPFVPGELALGARATFFARTLDSDLPMMQHCFVQSALHKGCSVTEILQNCVIFNDGAHKEFAHRDARAERTITLRQGEPMLYGKNMDKGIVLRGLKLAAVRLGEDGVSERDILVHDAKEEDSSLHYMLSAMRGDLPIALGVIRDTDEATYDGKLSEQIAQVRAASKINSIADLLASGEIWEVK